MVYANYYWIYIYIRSRRRGAVTMRIVIILCIITQITCWSFPVHERVSWINFLIATIIYIRVLEVMLNLIDNKHRWSINPNLLQKSCIQSGSIEKKNVNTPQSTLSKLGIWVLPNRRMCFAGRTIKGIVLPKNAKQQGIKWQFSGDR